MKRWKKIPLCLFWYGRYVFARGKTEFGFEHMPMSISRAVWNTALNKAAYRKIENGFFRDNLVVVIAPAKTGSKNLCDVIAAMDKAYRPSNWAWKRPFRQGWTVGRYMLDNSEIQIEMVIDTIDGGVIHTHASPVYRSLKVLNQLGSKYVLLARHPLHQLVAQYTQCLGELASYAGRYAGRTVPRFFQGAAFPIESAVFDGNRNTDDVIRFMIEEGYLESQLLWHAQWLEFRDPERSIFVRFEDMINGSGSVFQDLSQFLYGKRFEPGILAHYEEAVQSKSDQRLREVGKFHYPRGWTGSEEGVLAYVSDENLRRYNEAVSRFVASHRFGERLFEVFPEFAEV